MSSTKRTHLLVPILVFILCTPVLWNWISWSDKPRHPHVGLGIEQILGLLGYNLETHYVITEDGYNLTLHRIPPKTTPRNTPVLLMHGFLLSSVDFVNIDSNTSLALILADLGFDVFLGNFRGSTLSRRHIHLNPDSHREFWNYSMHEIGIYDTKAFVDFTLNITGVEQLQYVGYSQGTLVFFILVSERPEYARKIRLMTALAPAAFMGGAKSPMRWPLTYFRHFIGGVADFLEHDEVLSHNGFVSKLMKNICDENSIFVHLCLHFMFVFSGYNYQYTNLTRLALITSNMPSGSSVRQFQFVLQIMESNTFQKFDYGTGGNLVMYQKESPPLYNLSAVTNPVALYYSTNDWIVNHLNMAQLQETLPNVVKSYCIPSEHFNHNDFIYGYDIRNLLYNSVVKEIVKNA